MTEQIAHSILLEVLEGYSTEDRWTDAPFERIRRVQTAMRGQIGQHLVARLCHALDLESETGKVQSPWDIMIEGRTFEVKTATEGSNLTFQFNHIRYHRPYEFLLCVGITPKDILFDAWNKADVVTAYSTDVIQLFQGM